METAQAVEFVRELIRVQSYTGREEEIIRLIARTMERLDYDEVIIDSMGNLLGRVGSGPGTILFDAHVDTVEAAAETEAAGEGKNKNSAWEHPPFSGEIAGGNIYGRGAVDMKAGAGAAVYGAALAKKMGYLQGKTVYVSCTVLEEDCDGENLKHLFKERGLKPDAAVICEPSNNIITLGQKGKAQLTVNTKGVSAHGSAPERGKNAVYEMAEIIQRVEQINRELTGYPKRPRHPKEEKEAPRGTLVLSRISSRAASLNAVPYGCEIYLDRRLAPGETEAQVRTEMERITAGKEAGWRIDEIERTAWTGMKVHYRPFHNAWTISPDHPLAQACGRAYEEVFEKPHGEYDFWDFSTNGVTTALFGIPTIGFGPGDYKLAHTDNEHCPVDQIEAACRFYAALIKQF